MTNTDFYTAQQVAAKTGLGVDWLWKQAREKKIPHHRLGGRYRWTENDLTALADMTAVAQEAPIAMGVTDAARNLGISASGVRDAIYRGMLPAARVGTKGTRWSVLVEDLRTYRNTE